MKFVERNLSHGEFRFEYFNEEYSFIESQRHVVDCFFTFAENFIKPYGVELCFEQFDPLTELPMTKKDFQALLLKIENPKLSFMPIWTNTEEILVSKIDKETVMKFVLNQNTQTEQNDSKTGLSHLSFQTGLFRLPTKIAARKFYLERENQIDSAIEYECVSDEWFESPLQKLFLFPPIEFNFSREPYSKVWSLLISLNWDMYSPKNKAGFDLLSEKISLLIESGWICEFSSFQNDINS